MKNSSHNFTELTVLFSIRRFILYTFKRCMILGVLKLTSDYFFKPVLTTTFNSVIQPILALFKNVSQAMVDAIMPFSAIIWSLTAPIGDLLRKIRLIEINPNHKPTRTPNDLHQNIV